MFRLWLLVVVCGLAAAGHPPGARAKKASIQQIKGLKLLLNEDAKRQASAQQSDGFDIFSDVKRDPRAKPHPDELSVNDPEEYYQGDVDLSEQQVAIIADSLRPGRRSKRKIGKGPLYKLWDQTHAISFDFAEGIPTATKTKIRDAMRLWQRNTCIRFEENGPSIDRLEFFDGGGCSSFVGKVGGTQGISIATPGCDAVGIISHEIGHSLGNFHEQARPDQDHHINVNYNNIPLSRWNNFNPVGYNQAEIYGLPYDTGSVMHYGPYGFASDPYVPTIRTIERTQQTTIGQRAGPSFLDYQAINMAYNCYDHCPTLPCQRGGYPHPNNCTTCMCPAGLAGQYCDYIRESNQECGGVLEVTKQGVLITSPNYPSYFPRNSECYWLLKAPQNGKVFLEFSGEFDFICEDTCDKSYVEVKYHADFRLTGARYCCSSAPRRLFTSETNEMMVVMRGFGGAGLGFKAKVYTDVEDSERNIVLPKSEIPLFTTPTPVVTDSFSIETVITSTQPVKKTRRPTTKTIKKRPSPTSPPPTTATPFFVFPTATPVMPNVFTLVPFIETSTTTTHKEFTITIPTAPPVMTLIPSLLSSSPKPEGNIPINECGCGEWSEWVGDCTQVCGGCGHRERTRVCEKDSCRKMEKRPCNFKVCPQGTNFLINNGEFHILWRGCCVGLFRSGEECTALDSDQNPFLKIISSLLSANDQATNKSISTNHIAQEGMISVGEHGRFVPLSSSERRFRYNPDED